MTWDAYNRRKTALREIVDVVDRRRDLTPTDLLDLADPQREAFESEDALLLELQMTWFQRLAGALDRAADDTGLTSEDVAVATWTEAAAGFPGARTLLDAHLDRSELATALANEHRLMAVVSGVPMHHHDAAEHGARITDVARERAVYPVLDGDLIDDSHPRFSGIVARLRSALAA